MLKNKSKKVKVVVAVLTVLFIMLVGLVSNKILYVDKYNSKIKVSNIELKNLNSSNETNQTSEDVIQGYDTISYEIKYKLETEDKKEIDGRTAIVEATLTDAESKYATWNNIEAENVKSEIINDGKTLRLTVSSLTTNKEYTTVAKINITGAPDGYTISPKITVKEKTSEDLKMEEYTNTEVVETRSISGKIINKEEGKFEENVELEICKTSNGLCENKKLIYSKEDGEYVFSDLEVGKYQIKIADESKYALLSEIPEIDVTEGNITQDIEVLYQGDFRASITKYIKQVIVNENGKEQIYDYNKVDKALVAVKNVKNATIKIIYEFEIKNETEKEGYVKVIKENIPEGLIFDSSYEENKNWEEIDGKLYNKELSKEKLKANETKTIQIALKTESTEVAKNYLNKVSITGEHYYTVKYLVNDEVVKELSVLDSDKVNDYDYKKEGYTFTGWYTDKEYKNKYDFDSVVEKDFILYGKIEKIEQISIYKVTYIDQAKKIEDEKIEEGTSVKPNKICQKNGVCEKEGYEFECFRDSENPGVCLDEEVTITKNMTIVTSYTKIPTPIISHEPTNWINTNVNISMSLPQGSKIIRNTTNVITESTGIVTYKEEENQTEEDLILTSDKYDLEYQVISEKSYNDETPDFEEYELNDTWNKYENVFEQEKNAMVVGKIRVKATNESSVNLEHQILNIDKKSPEIIKFDESNITAYSFDLDISAKDLQSGTHYIRIYKNEDLIHTEIYNSDLNIEKSLKYILTDLDELTTYQVRIEVEDIATNITKSETKDITTIEDTREVVAKIIGRNGQLNSELIQEAIEEAGGENLTEEEIEQIKLRYLDEEYYSLEEAIEACGDNQCTIQMVTNTNESVTIESSQDITLDLYGREVSGVNSNTIENKGDFTVIDTGDNAGSITNTKTDGIAIKNVDGAELTLGVLDEETPSVIVPNIVGTLYGIDVPDTSILNFYDGRIEGNIAINGSVNDKPSGYDPSVESNVIQVATLQIVGNAEASIGSKLYARLSDAVTSSKSGTYTESTINNLTSLAQINDEYYFEYDEETGALTNNNSELAGTTARSYVKIDLTDTSKYPNGVLLKVNAEINCEENVNNNGSISISDSLTSSGNSFVYMNSQYSELGPTNYTKVLNSGSEYYLHLRANNQTTSTFTINSITISPLIGEENINISELITSTYGFDYNEETGKITSNNQGQATSANSYIKLDLTDVEKYKDNVTLTINAEISSQSGYDYGYATVTESTIVPKYSDSTGRFIYISGEVEAKDYTITLETGKIYYLHLAYRKQKGFYESGTDTFTINSIKLTPIEVSNVDLSTVKSNDTYSFEYDEETGALTSNNQGMSNTSANSYIELDLTDTEKYSGNLNLTLIGIISSESRYDIGYAAITEDTTAVGRNDANNFIKTSGILDVEESIELESGKKYYLHIGYYKDSGGNKGSDAFIINSINLTSDLDPIQIQNPELITPSYGFMYDDQTGTISNNNGSNYVTSASYIKLDLTDTEKYTENVALTVNAEMSAGHSDGSVTITESIETPALSDSERIIYLYNPTDAKDYKISLKSGKQYYLHFRYDGIDTFKINYVKVANIDDELQAVYSEKIPVLNQEVDTIKLLKEITLNETLKIDSNKNVVLDLNGQTLKTSISDYVITNNGSLKITDSTYTDENGSSGQVLSTTSNVIYNAPNATLELEKGNIYLNRSSSSLYAIKNEGTLKPNNLFTIKSNSKGIYNGYASNINGNIVIQGGSYYAIENYSLFSNKLSDSEITSGYGIMQYANSELIIENSKISSVITNNSMGTITINSSELATVVNSSTGTININELINGSTITNSSTGNITIKGGNITTTSNAGISNTSGKVSIDGVTISSSSNYGVSNQIGEITIKNSNITGTTGVYNKSTGNIIITDSEITNGVDNVSTGEINLTGGTITSDSSFGIKNAGTLSVNDAEIIGSTYGIQHTSGTLTVKNSNITGTNNCGISISSSSNLLLESGVITSTNNYGICNNYNGTVNIGKSDGIVSNENIEIKSMNDYGLSNNGTLNWYDGIIKGPKGKTILGAISDVEKNYDILTKEVDTTADKLEHLYLGNAPIVQILDENGSATALQCGTESNVSCNSIQDAVNLAKNKETVQFIRNVIRTLNAETITIPQDKEIILDINGKEILGNNNFIINNGNLKLTDSQNVLDSSGKITTASGGNLSVSNSSSTILTNTNNLELNGVVTKNGIITNSENSTTNVNSGEIYRIVNNGINNVNGGKIVGIQNSSAGILNVSNGTIGIGEYDLYAGISNSGTVEIIDGIISNYYVAIDNDGILNVHNGYISSSNSNAIENNGTATINSGQIISSKNNGIYNRGQLTFNNGIVTSNATSTSYSGIDNYSGTLDIIKGTITGYTGVKNEQGGTANIKGGSITGKSIGVDNNYSGFMNITGGTIKGYSYGVRNYILSNGSLTIGVKGDINEETGMLNVSTTSPKIISTNSHGLYNLLSTSQVNFYDGIIKGKKGTNAIYGSVTDLEEGYDIIHENSVTETDSNGNVSVIDIAYLGMQPIVKNLTTSAEYYSLQTAVDEVNNGEVLQVMRGYQVSSTDASVNVPSDKEIELDINGNIITVTNEIFIENNGKLKITDSQLDNNKGNFNAATIKNNNGATLDVTGVTLQGSSRFNNSGTLSITESTIYGYVTNDSSTGTITINSGKLSYGISNGAGTLEIIDGEVNDNITNTTGTVTIKGGEINGDEAAIENTGTGKIYIYGGSLLGDNGINNESYGTVTIDGGTIDSRSKGYGIHNLSTGTIKMTNGNIISTNGIYNEGSGNIVISGGEITSDGNYGILNELPGTVTISGGTIKVTGTSVSSGAVYAIKNDSSIGTININGGKIEYTKTGSSSEAIYNKGVFNMTAGEIISSATGILNENEGYMNISGGTITSTNNAINNMSSTLKEHNITAGTFESSSSSAIYNYSSNMNIGINDGVVSNENLKIISKSNAGLSNNNGTINWYDGIIKGTTEPAISGKIKQIETGYYIVLDRANITDDELSHAYLGKSAVAQILDANGDSTELQCGTESNEVCSDLQTAITSAKSGETIKVIKDILTTSLAESITISSDKNIVLDTNGYIINTSKIINEGTLKIGDTKNELDTQGKITVDGGGNLKTSIDNSGNLELNSITYIGGNINNLDGGTLSVNGGYLDGDNTGVIINSNGVVDINGGLIVRYIKNTSTGTINVTNGEIYTTSSGWIETPSLENISTGTININGGTILSSFAIDNISGTINISSGVIGSIETAGTLIVNAGHISNIANTGVAKITTGTISTITNSGGLVIDNGNITTISNSTGTVSINDGTINTIDNKYTLNINGGKIDTITNGGTLNLISGTISGSTTGITNSGTLNIGTDDGVVSDKVPSITGSEYGISNSNTVNFYDGIITGATGKSVYGTINPASGYKINTVANKTESGEDTGTESSTLIKDDEVVKIIMYNGINYTDLQSAVNTASGTTADMTLMQDYTLTSDIIIPVDTVINFNLNGHTITYNGYTISGDGTFNIIDNVTETSLLGAIIDIFTNKQDGKNIIIYEMDDGSKLDVNNTYSLEVYNDDKYEKVSVESEKENVGRYTISSGKSDKMTTIDGKIYLNNIEEGDYRLTDNNGKEVVFTVESDGTLSGNIKENFKADYNKIMSTSYAELIINHQTGQTVIKYGLIIGAISLLLGLLIYIRKKHS